MNQENFIPLQEALNSTETQKKEEVIGLDRLFEENTEEGVIDAYEDDLKKDEIKQKRITRIQIGLILFLIVFASIVYFFGYDVLSPYIKID